MKQATRLNRLLELISDRGGVTVAEAEAELNVSGATIRRDLDHLAGQHLVIRSRGGALPVIGRSLSLQYRASKEQTAAQRIAAEIADQVREGDAVGLNASPLALEIARAVAARSDLAAHDSPVVTVVTNGVNVAHELIVRRHIKVVVTGGDAGILSYSLTGPAARRTLESMSLDLCALGATAFDATKGVTTADAAVAEIEATLASQADRVIVGVLGEQVGRTHLAQVVRTRAVSLMVTDDEAPAGAVKTLRAADLDVRCV